MGNALVVGLIERMSERTSQIDGIVSTTDSNTEIVCDGQL